MLSAPTEREKMIYSHFYGEPYELSWRRTTYSVSNSAPTMRVLLLGGTGNLGLRMIPALLAHNYTVIAYVRSEAKLRSLITPRLADKLTIHTGDALDTNAVEFALRKHNCDAVMNTAGNFVAPWREQVLEKIATSVSSAAVRVGRDRKKVLRAWFIGGITSLVYPFEGNVKKWKVEDFFPYWAGEHHRGTARAMEKVSTDDLEWSLLCVAWMQPASQTIDVLDDVLARHHNLVTGTDELVDWHGSWVGNVPMIGRFLDLFWCFSDFTTKLEDVANLIAEDLENGEKKFVGCLVSMKERVKVKNA